MDVDVIEAHVRACVAALPGAEERESHGAPAFFAGRQFAHLWARGHHDHHDPHLWCAAAPGVQDDLVAADPGRFFRPPYVGHRGWLGVRLDATVDWQEVAELLRDAFLVVAPATLRRQL